MAEERQAPTPGEQVARLYEQAEAQASKAGERFVGSGGFASLMGQMAENAAALTRLGNDAMDLMIRNLRLAGRRDAVRLARQLARTEDKLERVLQELEALRDQVAAQQDGSGSSASASSSRRNSRSSNGSSSRRASPSKGSSSSQRKSGK